MHNADYWARRFKQMEDALEDQSYEYVKKLEKQFDAAIRELEAQMRVWYQRFAENNSITYAEAQKLLKSEELAEFKWTVQEYIKKGKENAMSGEWMKELENASARVHVSRFESLKYQLRQQAEVLTQAKIKAAADAAGLAYTESYYHTAFEVQRGFGVGWSMQGISESALKKVLARPWAADGQDFTARCWKDKARLVQTVNQELTRMIATGAAPDKAIEAIARQFKTSKNNAGRVVMTESAVFAGVARKDCFEELGVEKFKVIETLDTSTCEVCGEMDGKIFSMREHAIGATAPPFHPWCRGCTAPYFADMEGLGARYARDVKTNKGYTAIPRHMTYAQWKEMQEAFWGEGSIDKMRIISYNINADKEQYEKYVARLGTEVPESFSAFQKMKYNDTAQYEDIVEYYRYRGYNPTSERRFYEGHKAAKALREAGEIRAKGTVVAPPQGRIIARMNDHATESLINRGLTQADAQHIIDNAAFALKQRMGAQHAFYDESGYAVLDNSSVLTSIGQLDEGGKKLYKEVMKHVGIQ